jgi:hypothetical protein
VTARRAKRENGGVGEDPPGNLKTHQRAKRAMPWFGGMLVKLRAKGGWPPERRPYESPSVASHGGSGEIR